MKNSVSDQSFYIESEDEEEEVEKFNRHEDDGHDIYTYFSSAENLQQSKPSSLATQWPQSYRQSIDLYSNVPSPTIGFLGTPTVSRLGSSFLLSSLTRRFTPEIQHTPVRKPLLPPSVDDEIQPDKRSCPSAIFVCFYSWWSCCIIVGGTLLVLGWLGRSSWVSQQRDTIEFCYSSGRCRALRFGICTLLYAGTAIVGYKMFGEAAESQFTLNMPKDLIALEELLPSRFRKSHFYPIVIRTLLVISTLLVGLSVPFFGLVLSLIGSLLTMLVALILPPACYLSILRGKVSRIQAAVCIIIIAVGVVSSVIGTYSALTKIIENLRNVV
ncbi:putative NBS type disease resistance protein [Hibiscus syriacus]|uniref:NBS type disease resistance protein n=1 Tax=Hibiscus syriacus TaxID=106335 RepID=A0A6A2YCG2_HIBSY|nr:putative NBS type disease resistance protein [Hibiscus syriacus]